MEVVGTISAKPNVSANSEMWAAVRIEEHGTHKRWNVKGTWPWPVQTALEKGTEVVVTLKPDPLPDTGFGQQYQLSTAKLLLKGVAVHPHVDALAQVGITPAVAKILCEHFGAAVVSLLCDMQRVDDFSGLGAIKGMTPARVDSVRRSKLSLISAAECVARSFPGLAPSEKKRMTAFHSDVAVLQSNPFVCWSSGILSFERARALCKPTDAAWEVAHVLQALRLHVKATGDVCMHAPLLADAVSRIGCVLSPARILALALSGESLLCLSSGAAADDDGSDDDEEEAGGEDLVPMSALFSMCVDGEYVYLRGAYDSETEIVQYIAAAAASAAAKTLVDPEWSRAAATVHEQLSAHNLDATQAVAATNMVMSPVSILTGGAGTGKTHILRAVNALFKSAWPGGQVLFLAPTGCAALRIQTLMHQEVMAFTMHSLMYRETMPVSGRHVLAVVDEASMADVHIFGALLKMARREGWRLACVGDVNQLPPVGMGAPFKALLELARHGNIPCTVLKRNYRTEESGEAVAAAAANVLAGVVPPGASIDGRFCVLETLATDVVAAVLAEVDRLRLTHSLPQVLAHTNAMCNELNLRIRERFFPEAARSAAAAAPTRLTPSFDWQWAVGDLVVMTKNRYVSVGAGSSVKRVMVAANGTRGEVTRVQLFAGAGSTVAAVTVRLENPPCEQHQVLEYVLKPQKVQGEKRAAGKLQSLRPAYAITVHKAQGGEFPCVVYAARGQFGRERKYVYTGMTRARAYCSVVTTPGYMEVAVVHDEPDRVDRICARCL